MTSSHQQTLTRARIKESFYHKLEISIQDANSLLESIIHEINSTIIAGHDLKIVSFGTFLVHTKKERMGRNPKTKEDAVIEARKSVSFRPSALLRELVNKPVK